MRFGTAASEIPDRLMRFIDDTDANGSIHIHRVHYRQHGGVQDLGILMEIFSTHLIALFAK